VLGVVLAAVLLPKRLRIPRNKAEPLTWTITPILIVTAGTLPMVIAGISVLAGGGGQLRTDCSHNLARYAPFGVTQSV